MIRKFYIPTTLFFLSTVALLFVIMLSKSVIQVPIKIVCSSSLVVMYAVSVAKDKWDKNYFILALLFSFGDGFYSFPIQFFSFSFVFYTVIYIIFTLYIYKELKNKDWFRIFTFASPFIFTYGVIILLLKNVTPLWFLAILITGFTTCINASVITLNYASKRSKRNFFFFIGMFLIQMMNFLAVMHYFNEQSKNSYYLIINTLSLFSQYLICLGFITPKEDEEV